MAQDKLLLESFLHGQDVHARTAAEVFGVPLAEVEFDDAYPGEGLLISVSFMASAILGWPSNAGYQPRMRLPNYIKSYFARYTGVKQYMDDTVQTRPAAGLCSDDVWAQTLSA